VSVGISYLLIMIELLENLIVLCFMKLIWLR